MRNKFIQNAIDIWNGEIRPATEKDKDAIVTDFVNKLDRETFSHSDRSEILNRMVIRVFEKKKETRTKLLKDIRELQESMREIKVPQQTEQ